MRRVTQQKSTQNEKRKKKELYQGRLYLMCMPPIRCLYMFFFCHCTHCFHTTITSYFFMHRVFFAFISTELLKHIQNGLLLVFGSVFFLFLFFSFMKCYLAAFYTLSSILCIQFSIQTPMIVVGDDDNYIVFTRLPQLLC